jgi:hypothetical protein
MDGAETVEGSSGMDRIIAAAADVFGTSPDEIARVAKAVTSSDKVFDGQGGPADVARLLVGLLADRVSFSDAGAYDALSQCLVSEPSEWGGGIWDQPPAFLGRLPKGHRFVDALTLLVDACRTEEGPFEGMAHPFDRGTLHVSFRAGFWRADLNFYQRALGVEGFRSAQVASYSAGETDDDGDAPSGLWGAAVNLEFDLIRVLASACP